MQPLTKHREVTTGGVVASTAFSISLKDQAHIKSILRDTLYSDKIMAVLREYSANAWDAHRMAGKPELPIRVQLPTEEKPVLQIQDWGTGLSHEEVFEVFARYGASTKRDSNEAVGMLGIGSKSGFAYSDTFTIISCHGGKRRTYVALLDENENDNISLLSEVDNPTGEVGITIEIAVNKSDIQEFERKARMLYQHFNPRPQINIELPKAPEIRAKMKNGTLFNSKMDSWDYNIGQGWCAVMGCVPYRIDMSQLKNSEGKYLIPESFTKTKGLLYFDIGQIQINASREDLKYSKITKDTLVQKFLDFLDEFVVTILDEIENGTGTAWEKRIQAQTLLQLGLGKEQVGDWGLDRIEVDNDKYSTFVIRNYANSSASTVIVERETRFVRYTDIGRKKLSGFKLNRCDYLIQRKAIFTADASGVEVHSGMHTWEEVEVELKQMIKDNNMEGIQIVDLHTLPWAPAKSRSYTPRDANPKHMKRVFKYIKKTYGSGSDHWEAVDHIPQDDDVFVILSHFETYCVADQHFNVVQQRHQDEKFADFMDVTLPEIYGYKTTDKKPLTLKDIKGVPYAVWREKFYKDTKMTPEVLVKCEAFTWNKALSNHCGFWNEGGEETVLLKIGRMLGDHHPITDFILTALSHKNADSKYDPRKLREWGRYAPEEMQADIAWKNLDLTNKYPLLNSLKDLVIGRQSRTNEYIRYVQLIDLDEQAKKSLKLLSLASESETVSEDKQEPDETEDQPQSAAI